MKKSPDIKAQMATHLKRKKKGIVGSVKTEWVVCAINNIITKRASLLEKLISDLITAFIRLQGFNSTQFTVILF